MPGEYGQPLITQRTDLKSLKYTLVSETTGETLGEDPYVTKKVPDHYLADGELRVDPNPPKASGIIRARLDDTQRISKMLVSKPGQKFAQNLGLLKLSQPNGVKNLLDVPKVLASTLAQVPVSGTGTHFIYGFNGDQYLKSGGGTQSVLGEFLLKNLGIGGGLDGAKGALRGDTLIPDNEGQQGYAPLTESKLVNRNSRYDTTEGFDEIKIPYLRDDLKQAFSFIKGIFTKKQEETKKGIPSNLGSIFKTNPLNLGQEGFRTEKREDSVPYDSIQSQLKGPENPSAHLFNSQNDVDGRNSIKGGSTKVTSDNDGGRGYTPSSPDFLPKKESTQTINVNGVSKPLRPEFTLSNESVGIRTEQLSDQTVTTRGSEYNERQIPNLGKLEADENVKASGLSAGLNPTGPSTTGRIMPQIGPDGIAEGEFRTFVDDEGGVTGVIERDYDPNNPSQLKMYLQDQPGIVESEELKTELGGTVSSGNTNSKRITKLIDFRKVRKWGVNAGVHGKTESIGPDSNGYTSTTPTDLLPDYTTDNVEVRLKMGQKGAPDFINVSDVIEVGNTSAAAVAEDATWQYYNGDIIPFAFNTLTPDGQKFLFFRAFLDDLSDNYSGDWAGTQYIGRAEEFHTYQGFKRNVSFNFKVAAFTKEELLPLYKKLNHLVASTAPTYSKAGNFMRGTLTTLSIGEYLDRQDGFITKVDLNWEKGYPWEIDLFNENLPKVPTILNVSVSFTPIHSFEVKNDIDLENKNESYFGAQYGVKREKVERLNTTTRGPVTTSTRPEAEIPKIPKPEPVKTVTPVPAPTAPVKAPDALKIEVPTVKSSTVQPTTQGIDGLQAGTNLDKTKTINNNTQIGAGFEKKYTLVDSGERKSPSGFPEFYATYTYQVGGKPGVGEGSATGPTAYVAEKEARYQALLDYNLIYGR